MKRILLIVFASLQISTHVLAQEMTPVEYMNFFNDREQLLSKDYLSYMSAVAHSGRARKMEKRRLELINTIKEAVKDGSKLKPYKGDASLKNAYLEYWNILISVFNEDYHKIVDMEEVAERSYDAMEAYILAQEKVDEKVNLAHEKLYNASHAFALTHNITLSASDSNLSKKVKQASAVNTYYNMLYLVFFKASVQETYLLDAIKSKNINAVEQSRNSLIKFADEGLTRLDTIKAFDGDKSLIEATRKVFNFYKKEATQNVPPMSDYFIKADEFAKMKKVYDAKPHANLTKADVDAYNKAVNEMNSSVVAYNKANEEANKGRSSVLTAYDNAKKDFMDAHVPYK